MAVGLVAVLLIAIISDSVILSRSGMIGVVIVLHAVAMEELLL